jgi:hypothetical protein
MESAPTNAINIDAVRFHVREALKALEADVGGEKIRDVEKHTVQLKVNGSTGSYPNGSGLGSYIKAQELMG